MLAFYLAFQLETDEAYLEKYRAALEGWWHSISRSENPLWYYIYQLAHPQRTDLQDHFGGGALEVAAWQLSRHPPSARNGRAYVEGAREDVILEGRGPVFSLDPTRVVARRRQGSDGEWAKRGSSEAVFPEFDSGSVYEMKVLPSDERSIHKFNGASFDNPGGGNDTQM